MIESNPFATIKLPGDEDLLGERGEITDVHPTVVKVEPERLGLAVAQGERGGGLGGVEQLSRYLDLMRRDTLLGTVHGILAAQLIKPQARVLANDRGISCVTVDYDTLRGLDNADDRLF